MKIKLLYLFCCTCLPLQISHAYSNEEDIVRSCKQVTHLATLGQKAYQDKKFSQALEYFQDQVSWSEFCSMHEELTGQLFSREQIFTAYNNAGITHAKLGQPRWARAWYSLAAKDSKSIFNLKALPPITPSRDKAGTYVQYAGQGQWNSIVVKAQGTSYSIDVYALWMGINAMFGGIHIGEFSTTMAKNAAQTNYHYENCVINLDFNQNAIQGEEIIVKQNGESSDCGFGMNVSTEGTYVKVEDVKDYSRYDTP